MTPTGAHLEEALEATIEAHLLANGWHQGANTSYDRDLALDTVELFTFIGATQIDAWDKLIARHGGDQETAQRKFKARLTDEVNRRGVIDVLRRGVTDPASRSSWRTSGRRTGSRRVSRSATRPTAAR